MHRVTAAQMIHLRYSLADRRRKKRCIFRDKKKKKERKKKEKRVGKHFNEAQVNRFEMDTPQGQL